MTRSIPTTPSKIVRRGAGHGPTLGLLAAAIAVALALLLFREPAGEPGVGSGDPIGTESALVGLTDPGVNDGVEARGWNAPVGPRASSPIPRQSAYREPARAPANEPATLDLTVVDVDGPVERPVEGALVTLGDRLLAKGAGSASAANITDADGRLTLEAWPRHRDSIHVSRRGSSWSQVFTLTSPKAGVTAEHKVRLHTSERSTELEVRSFPSNQAIAGAEISIGARGAMLVQGLPRQSRATVAADAHGRFVIPTSRPGTRDPFKVTVTAPGHRSAEFTQGDSEPSSRTIQLIKNARLSGRLALNVVAPGAPAKEPRPQRVISAKEINTFSRSGTRNVYMVAPEVLREATGSSSRRTFTGVAFDPKLAIANGLVTANDEWEIEDLEFQSKTDRYGPVLLLATAEGHSRILATDVQVGPGDDLVIADQLLEKNHAPLTLHFSYGDGRPLSGISSVRLERVTDGEDDRLTVYASIDDSGQTTQLPLSAGSWRWSFPGSPLPTLTEGEIRHEGAMPHQVRIDGITSIEGRIAGRNQRGRDFVHWQRWDPDADGSADGAWLTQASIESEPDGRFMLPLVPAGGLIRLVAERASSALRFNVGVTTFDGPESVTVRLPGGVGPWTGTVLEVPKVDQSTRTLTPGVK